MTRYLMLWFVTGTAGKCSTENQQFFTKSAATTENEICLHENFHNLFPFYASQF